MKEDTLAFASRDGIQIQTWRWAPEGAPRAVVQVQHGLGEHGGRYRRFAEALTAAGYLVYARQSPAAPPPAATGIGGKVAGRAGSMT